jgi:hypothetical protein
MIKVLRLIYDSLAIHMFSSIFDNDASKIISKRGRKILETSTPEELEAMIKEAQK